LRTVFGATLCKSDARDGNVQVLKRRARCAMGGNDEGEIMARHSAVPANVSIIA
jgi:hypothetical protein